MDFINTKTKMKHQAVVITGNAITRLCRALKIKICTTKRVHAPADSRRLRQANLQPVLRNLNY